MMPKGFAMREQLAPKAQKMRAEGLKLREISEALGVALSTVGEWCSDPDRVKHKARRMKYAGECLDCGAPTDGSAGPDRASKRCNPCNIVFEGERSRAWLVEAIRAWADLHGGIPPSATDWNPGKARMLGHVERAAECERGGWPAVNSVQGAFGSWNAGIEAAGFEPTAPSEYGRAGEDPELCVEIRERYEAGEGSPALGEAYDCSALAILYRVRKAGGTIRTHGEAMALRRAA